MPFHVEVLAVNPCDPMRRPANYPRLWTDLSFLGLGQHQTTILGCLNGVLFVFGVLALAVRGTAFQGLLLGALAFSPAVMLGVERGNVDLTMFAMTVAGILLVSRARVRALAGYGLILLAALLKLFPIFAVAGLLKQSRRS